MMILLILACSLSVVLLFAILAIARRSTSLLLLLSLLALLLVELEVFPLVLDCGDTVGILCIASVAASEAALFPDGFQGLDVFQRLGMLGHWCGKKSSVDHLL
jgi:hypothetical protein